MICPEAHGKAPVSRAFCIPDTVNKACCGILAGGRAVPVQIRGPMRQPGVCSDLQSGVFLSKFQSFEV